MLIYNTTFQVDDDVHDNFLIWIKESYIPEVQKHGALKTPRICRILSHREEGSAYSLQWEVESSGMLHRWHLEQGTKLNEELVKIFDHGIWDLENKRNQARNGCNGDYRLA